MNTPYRSPYHRYFTDYEERRVPSGHGRGTRIERVYIGQYYFEDCDDRTRRMHRILLGVSWGVCLFCFILGACTPSPESYTRAGALLQTGVLLQFLYSGYLTVSYIFSGKQVTQFVYDSVLTRLKAAGMLLLASFAVLLAVKGYFAVSHDTVMADQMMGYAGWISYLTGSISALFYFRTAAGFRYGSTGFQRDLREDAVLIQNRDASEKMIR